MVSGPYTARALLPVFVLLAFLGWFAVTYFMHDGFNQRLIYRYHQQGVCQQRQDPATKRVNNHMDYSDGAKQVYLFEDYTPWQNKSDWVMNNDNLVRMLSEKQVHCGKKIWAGTYNEGSWEMCVAQPYKPRSTGCLVYSFGLNYQYGYESHMVETESCLVRAYDPSMNSNGYENIKKGGKKEIKQNLIYYKTGLGGKVNNNKNWDIQTLGAMIKINGDEERIIDMLKMDVEFAEWAAFQAMFDENSLRNVKQLAFEIHIKWDMEHYFKTLFQLECIGFRRYLMNRNPQCAWCFEVYYVNTNFL